MSVFTRLPSTRNSTRITAPPESAAVAARLALVVPAANAWPAVGAVTADTPQLEHAKLGGHTGGNLLLSMMQRYSGDFLDAIDGLRALLGCRGRVWPVSVPSSSPRTASMTLIVVSVLPLISSRPLGLMAVAVTLLACM